MPVLVLASGSPRRRELLAAAGLAFESVDPGDDGPAGAAEPAARVLAHARHKASAGQALRPGRWVLAADTLVVLAGEFLAKPADAREAEAMLRRLSGRHHEVWTGVVLAAPGGARHEAADRALVAFRSIAEEELRAYLASGEWRGKAGAYAIQGRAGAWAELLEGDRETVIGLATATVRRLLAASGACSGASRG